MKADFDPDKFGSVFSMLDSSQLAWLEGLAADPAGRQLIYQLSATHRSCLLLNFAIQKILYAGGAQPRGVVMCANVQGLSTSLCLMLACFQPEAAASHVFLHCLPSPERLRSMYVVRWVLGECWETCKDRVFMLFTCHQVLSSLSTTGHEDEVASVGSSLAGYFGVFHRLMASRLKEVPTASAARLAAIAAELQDSCCGAEHSYVHAAQLLAKIGRHKHGAGMRHSAAVDPGSADTSRCCYSTVSSPMWRDRYIRSSWLYSQ